METVFFWAMIVSATILVATYLCDWIPRLGKYLGELGEEQTVFLYKDSQVLIDTFYRGTITEKQFRANALWLEFPAPMIDDIVFQRHCLMQSAGINQGLQDDNT